MTNKLFTPLFSHPDWPAIRQSALEKSRLALFDMQESQRNFVAAALAEDTRRQVLYLLPNERLARIAYEDALQLTQGSAVFLPEEERFFLRGATASRDNAWQRLKALDLAMSGEARLVIASIEALQDHLPPADWFRASAFSLKPGDSIEPQALSARLTAMGYERVDLVEGRGQYALRGDILDCFSPNQDSPARIEFFDVQVDSIRTFDTLTQRSQEHLPCLRVIQAAEHLVPEAEREQAAARLQGVLDAADENPFSSRELMPLGQSVQPFFPPDPEDIRQQGSIPNMAMWAHAVYPITSILDWMPEAIIVVDTPDRAMQRLDDNLLGFVEAFKAAFAQGNAGAGQAGLLRSRDEVLSSLENRSVIALMALLRGLGGLKPEISIEMRGLGIAPYHSRPQALVDDLKRWQGADYSVFLFSGGQARGQRLREMLEKNNLRLADEDEQEATGIRLIPSPLSAGFLLEEAKLAILAPGELFGAAQQKAKKRHSSGERIAAFTDLSVGDYVVHEHHGIGLYQGTTRLQSEGVWRDYLLIHYQGSDKLYVPTDQFDRVQKYLGSQGEAPQLHSLSGGDWEKQKKKTREGVKKLAFDLVQLYAKRQAEPGYAFDALEPFESQFADQFEYELTADQAQAINEVLSDMARPVNMDRLLCGDVGYGKTEVALRAAFRAVLNGKQVALLAPTTILIQQHMRTFSRRFSGFPVKVDFVSRFRSPRENKRTLQEAKEGKVDILLGTHRLLSKDAQFKDLGLLIVDEEQRFGVKHKEMIKNYRSTVDVLTLSATPIPRTLHMSMVGVRDMSLLETPPEERLPVNTYVVDYQDGLIRDAILRELARDGQVYFLYNRVADIERMASRLRQLVPEASVAVAHGQMREQALEDVMMDFYAGKYDVLLSSTIIENGLDIPNANTLIVYDADHFGLSQLYQLRGRVGRSSRSAYAYFTIRPDRSMSETAEKRLNAIKEFTAFGAGFRIAMRDLEIRGAGNIFGPEQSGQVATVGYDMYCKMIEEAIREAQGDFSSYRANQLETRVDLHVNAYLPESYVPGETQRIEIYKRIAAVSNQTEQETLIDDLIDRFGEPSVEVLNLIEIAWLRALANTLGADYVRFFGGALSLRLHPEFSLDPGVIYETILALNNPRISLSAGKRPAFVIKTKAQDEEGALYESRKFLSSFVAKINSKTAPTINDTDEPIT
jgi:transcription-repair coupling factor (superfamily II helicase)